MEMLQAKGWLLGGENSGHILCLDRHTTGDGIISALQVLAALCMVGGCLKDMLSDLQLYPQSLLNVPIPKAFSWQACPEIVAAQALVAADLGERGRVLLRASGTEPLMRVMVEGQDIAQVTAAAEFLAAAVRQASGCAERKA